MARRKRPYKEGDWFGVPLLNGGHAVGLIARAGQTGHVLFGYFFGPQGRILPGIEALSPLISEDAIFVGMFSDHALLNNEWPVIGSSPVWDRTQWPLPLFARIDEIDNKAFLSQYSEDDPNEVLREESCDIEKARGFPRDRLSGTTALQVHLTELLSNEKHKK